MMPSDDPDRVMMIQQKWSRSSDDPDPVMMPSDDPDPVMMLSDDLDPVMIQIQWWCLVMIQIEWWSKSKDEDDLNMKMTWRLRRLEDADDPEKKTSAENCV